MSERCGTPVDALRDASRDMPPVDASRDALPDTPVDASLDTLRDTPPVDALRDALPDTPVDAQLDTLVDALLFEGYALYPYTPAAAKNATPTPFGIVYPPAYAATLPSAFNYLELRCVLDAPRSASLSAEVRFLAATGRRHEAAAYRLAMPPTSVGALAARSRDVLSTRGVFGAAGDVEDAGGDGEGGRLVVSCQLRTRALGENLQELVLCVENLTPCAAGLDRAAALTRSLVSTHPLLRTSAGRFVSPLERRCGSVNTFPVLATEADDAVLGTAIVLPDHPQIAPESQVGMFDSTEIEEALLLHVRALSDGERRQIEHDDPRVREMVERAAAVTPEEVLALHGRVTLRDREPRGLGHDCAHEHASRGLASSRSPIPPRDRVSDAPPREPEGLPDPTRGEAEAVVEGVRFRRGAKVRLRPGEDADLHARLLAGRTATIERILVDYDGRPHLGVTIDGDPGQELMRDTGRLLFFFAPEVEVLDARG